MANDIPWIESDLENRILIALRDRQTDGGLPWSLDDSRNPFFKETDFSVYRISFILLLMVAAIRIGSSQGCPVLPRFAI
jgi:hypothetical protein